MALVLEWRLLGYLAEKGMIGMAARLRSVVQRELVGPSAAAGVTEAFVAAEVAVVEVVAIAAAASREAPAVAKSLLQPVIAEQT
jgi:hypothetical protein